MTAAEKDQFDIQLAPPEARERTIDEQNAEAMKLLMGGKHPSRKPVPLKERRRRRE